MRVNLSHPLSRLITILSSPSDRSSSLGQLIATPGQPIDRNPQLSLTLAQSLNPIPSTPIGRSDLPSQSITTLTRPVDRLFCPLI